MKNDKRILDLYEQNREFWDKKINDGIEKNRKGDFFVRVTDKNGNAVSGATLSVRLKNHAFRFGANIFMLDEMESEYKNSTYKELFKNLFNLATLPFYWCDLEPEKGKTRYKKGSPRVYRRPSPDLCLEFCEENGIEAREHALAYEHFFPDWLKDADTDTVKRELERRYCEISERYADKCPTVEITNEMEWNKGKTKFYDDKDFIKYCFELGEKYFRGNTLCSNEHTWLCWADRCRATDKYYSYIEANMLKGARIDAIGMQYHLFYRAEKLYEETRTLLDPNSIYGHMNLYSNLSNNLQVTEVTVPSYSWEEDDEQLQADVVEFLYSIWFSHPSVTQIIYWNLVDGYAYCPDSDPVKIRETQGNMEIGENYYHGGLLRFDMTPKKAYFKLMELIKDKWSTNIEISSDENGLALFRGFFGDYEVRISVDGKEVDVRASFTSGENTLSVVI